jgi:Glycosyl transferases group 1
VNIACFYPGSLYCAWSLATGLIDTLERMGHQVTALPIEPMPPAVSPSTHAQQLRSRFNYPSSEQLRNFDAILISGPEHLRNDLLALYPDWRKIAVPKAAWMHETVEREDYGRLPIEEIRKLSDCTFTPAIQDEKYGLRWLPFGVDTEVFKPDWSLPKQYDAAFIGLMYAKREQFLGSLVPLLGDIKLVHGNIQVQDLSGLRVRETAALYADNLRKIKVFVNLPTLCQLAVTKVYEVMACGTFLITPAIAEHGNFDNLLARFYLSDRPDQLAESIRLCLAHDEERAEATRLCCEQVHQSHRLDLRCEVLISAIGGS